VSAASGTAVQIDSGTKQVLVWAGGLLMALVAGLVLAGYGIGTRAHTTTRSASTPAATTSAATTTTATGTVATAGRSSTVTKSPPSDTMLTEILGVGALLMLVGFLYPRINTIKLPGGAELDLATANAVMQQQVKALATASGQKDPTAIASLQKQAVAELANVVGFDVADLPSAGLMTSVHPLVLDTIARGVIANAPPPEVQQPPAQ